MNVLIGITGGIAAYKACDLVSILRKKGFDVRIIMTHNAEQFITPLTLATLSRHPIMNNMWAERQGKVDHIDIGKWAHVFAVYPATANIIAKFANGIADDLLSTVYLALPRGVKKIIFPAANTNMLEHAATQRNIQRLADDNCFISKTRETELACGDVGKGALMKPSDAAELVEAMTCNMDIRMTALHLLDKMGEVQ